MASFVVSTATTTGQSLLSSEAGIITEGGAIIVGSGSAVAMTGSANLTVLGAIGQSSNSPIIGGTVSFPTIVVGESGYIGNLTNTAIILILSDDLQLENAGTIRGESSALFVAPSDAAATVNLNNSGMMNGYLSFALNLNLGNGQLNLFNSGEISGPVGGIFLSSGSLFLTNTGTIANISGGGAIVTNGVFVDRILNTGSIFGDIDLGDGDDWIESSAGLHFGQVLDAAGADRILMGAGENAVFGGTEDDTLSGGADDDQLSGDDGIDRLFGGTGDDLLLGGALNDTLTGGEGADTLDGGLDRDTVNYRASASGVDLNLTTGTASGGDAANDLLIGIEDVLGSAYDDDIIGNAGGNSLQGERGADILDGLGGSDALFGGSGNDTLSGGLGFDALTGGRGADVFVFAQGFAQDTIKDYNDARDQIDLTFYGFADTATALSFAAIVGADVVFTLGGGDTLTLKGIVPLGLTVADMGDNLLI